MPSAASRSWPSRSRRRPWPVGYARCSTRRRSPVALPLPGRLGYHAPLHTHQRGGGMDDDLAAVGGLVEAAEVPEAARQGLLWCVGQLPRLYQELVRTCESRYADEIGRVVGGVLKALAKDAAAAEAVVARLRGMHERLGIPRIAFPAQFRREAG